MRVIDISLVDVVKRYLAVNDVVRDGNSNRYKVRCPFHAKDSNPSLILYDKTAKGEGWNYHCFTCGAHGTAPSLLFHLKLADSEDHAVQILREDFHIEYPDTMCVQGLAEVKGLDPEFLYNQGWVDNKQTVEIPFFDEVGELLTTKVRTKYAGKDKYFYKGVINQGTPYGLHWLARYEDAEPLYLTEGETDCVTLRQAGYQAIGIMGTNGYNSSYKPYFERFETIVVVRDNDEAGWFLMRALAKDFPKNLYIAELPKGVKDINDYNLYRCHADKQIFKASFDTMPVIPATPEGFIRAVKEGAVAATERTCWDMVLHFITGKPELLAFKDTFAKATKTTKAVITECIKAVTAVSKDGGERIDSDIEFLVDGNAYYKAVYRGDAVYQERITNFVIDPMHDIHSEGEVTRCVSLTNTSGRTVSGVMFDGETLASVQKFNGKCMSVGDYLFTGTQEDLAKLCYGIFRAEKRTIHSPRRIGRLENGSWLFGNCGIDQQGQVVPMGPDGFIVMDGVSYCPRSIVIDDEGTSDIPMFDMDLVGAPLDLGKVARDFRETFGTYGAWLALGWVVAGWFSDEIFASHSYFPYLFVTGKRASGKSVMCTMLTTAFGINPATAGMSIETPSNVGMLRYLAFLASLPKWYDDYRNDVKRIAQKDGMLLDIYNRHGSAKGTREAGVIRQEKVNGFLLLSGEDTPKNNALLSRCVTVELTSYERNPLKYGDAVESMKSLAQQGLAWLSRGSEGLAESIKHAESSIFASCGDARYAGNAGIFLGSFLWAFAPYLEQYEIEGITAYAKATSEEDTKRINDEHPVAQFFNDIPLMYQKGLITKGQDFHCTEGVFRYRAPVLHNAWEQLHHVAPIGKRTLLSYIEKEPFYQGDSRFEFDGMGRQRCVELSIDKMRDEFPDFEAFCDAVLQGSRY